MNTNTGNVDAEYRVLILGELVATFTDVEAAADEYTAHACIRCWTHANRLPIGTYSDRTLCCDVQTGSVLATEQLDWLNERTTG